MRAISAISFSYAANSLQSRGLSLLDRHLGFRRLYNMSDFDIPLCYSNKPDGVVPPGVAKFDRTLGESDAWVFAIAEAGGHYCAAFKNIMDWLIVKNRFNSQLGEGYSLSGKPVYVFTFTPTYEGAGDRHFELTKYILAQKFGADVRGMFVLNRCWENVVPGNQEFVRTQAEAIGADLARASGASVAQAPVLAKYDVEKWVRQYEAWDRQWTE